MTRTQILAYLADHQPATLHQIAEHFGISRQAVRDCIWRCEKLWLVRKGEPVPAQWGGALADTWLIAHDRPQLVAPQGYGEGGIVERAKRSRCALALAWAADAQGAV